MSDLWHPFLPASNSKPADFEKVRCFIDGWRHSKLIRRGKSQQLITIRVLAECRKNPRDVAVTTPPPWTEVDYGSGYRHLRETLEPVATKRNKARVFTRGGGLFLAGARCIIVFPERPYKRLMLKVKKLLVTAGYEVVSVDLNLGIR